MAGLAGAALFAGREGEGEEAAAELEVPSPQLSRRLKCHLASPNRRLRQKFPKKCPVPMMPWRFLAKLAAGKEDQLRAEAKDEADVRMDAIMGRKPAEPKPAEPAQEGQPAIRLATTGLLRQDW